MTTSRRTRSGWRWAPISATAPQSWTTRRCAPTSSASRNRSTNEARPCMPPSKRSYRGRSERPQPGRSSARNGAWRRSRKGVHSPEWVGLPWTSTTGGPSPSPRLKNAEVPSTSTVACSIMGPTYPREVATGTWKRPTKRRVRAIRDRLRELYGRPTQTPHGRPVEELVRTILSQNTNDTNRDVAFDRLRERFPTWREVRDAPLDEVEDAIRPGGLAPQKAPRIQAALAELDDDISLDWLRDAPR